jgi:hypothetical protein
MGSVDELVQINSDPTVTQFVKLWNTKYRR